MSLFRRSTGLSRSEEIRKRRIEETVARTTAVKQATRPTMRAQPVVNRGSGYSTPVHQVTGSRPRRQIYYKLGTPGAEMRMMPLPQITVGWRAMSAMLVLSISALLVVFFSMPLFRVSFIEIEGLQLVSPLEIEAALHLSNQPIFAVDADQIRQTLTESFPELMDTQVSVGFPASVTIGTAERVPVLTWTYDGQTLAMDNTGVLYPARSGMTTTMTIQSNVAPPVLLEQAPGEDITTIQQLEPGLFQALSQLSAYLPAGTPLLYTQLDGLGWQDAQGWEVFVGEDLSQLNAKIALYETITAFLTQQGMQPGMISVEYLYAPYYRTGQ